MELDVETYLQIELLKMQHNHYLTLLGAYIAKDDDTSYSIKISNFSSEAQAIENKMKELIKSFN